MINVKGLGKRFKNFDAVRDVSFTVQRGEILGLLGENGAGKTTTLRMLATVLRPTSGTAVINSHDLVLEPQEVRASIGVLSGDEGCYPRLTARENVAFFARLNKMPEDHIRDRIKELFEMLDIQEYADRRAGQFSKGMKQKVAIARAIVHDPPVLLMDEPTAGLDVIGAKVVRDFLTHCRDRGKTTIFSSHVMSEVEQLCDRVAIIHRGSIVACGSIMELTGGEGYKGLEGIFARLVGETA